MYCGYCGASYGVALFRGGTTTCCPGSRMSDLPIRCASEGSGREKSLFTCIPHGRSRGTMDRPTSGITWRATQRGSEGTPVCQVHSTHSLADASVYDGAKQLQRAQSGPTLTPATTLCQVAIRGTRALPGAVHSSASPPVARAQQFARFAAGPLFPGDRR